MKILNLYAGVGGNRRLWGHEHEVTAVEIEPRIAEVYQSFFPSDNVVIGDAHQYLIDHYNEFDFIWSSPPCQTHSRARFWATKGDRYAVKYPDMSLYQEILFLKSFYNGLYVIENVIPYYDFLIQPSTKIGRHAFWANFTIPKFQPKELDVNRGSIEEYSDQLGFTIPSIGIRKDKIYRNCVHPETGLHILNAAIRKPILTQCELFN